MLLAIESWGSGRTPMHWKFLFEGSLSPVLVPDSVNSFCLKDYMCPIHPLYHLASISKFSKLLITCWESVVARILPASRINLEQSPYSREHAGMQPTAIKESPTGPQLSTIYRRQLTHSNICIPDVSWVGSCSTSPQLLRKIYGP